MHVVGRTIIHRKFRQAKVEDLGLAAFRDEDIGWLQVPVDNACRVRCVECVRDLDGVP